MTSPTPAQIEAAAIKLAKEVKASMSLFEPLARKEIGNSNYASLIDAADNIMKWAVALTAAAEVGEPKTEDEFTRIMDARVDATRATIERCAQEVPTTWLDELLTGKDASKLPFGEREVEALLRGIQDRIRKLKDEV